MALLTTVKPRNIDTTGDYVVNSISATGNVSANNIKTDHLLYANGSPYVFTTTASGTNTQIQFNDANSFAGSANLTYNKTSKTLNVDNITVTGNITPSADITYDLGSNSHRFKDLFLSGNTLLIGDGAITIDGNSMVLTNPAGGTFVVDGSNAAYASIASYVTEGNQSNITQVGTLVSLSVTGTASAGNIKTDNLLYANGVAYTLASFTNDSGYLKSTDLTSYATKTDVSNAVANLVNSAPSALDTLQELANALGNDASYSTSITNALANKLSTSSFTSTADTWLATKSTTNLAEGSNQYYTVARANTAIDNRVDKTFVDNLGVVANIANVAYSVAGANVVGQVGNALVAGTVYASAQPNITSLGTLNGLTVSGNITPSANVTYNLGNATNRFKDLYLSGTTIDLSGTLIQVASNGQINVGNATFTSTGTFDGASVTGEVAYANVANHVAGANVSGAVAFATTANAVAGANVSGQVGNAIVAGTVYTAAQPNITSVGTLTSLSVTGNVTAGNIKSDNLLYANGTAYTLASFTNDIGYLVASNLSAYATQTYVNSAVANLVNSAPTALDTLQELANALGNDASYSTTITNSLANKLSTSSFTSTADTWLATKSTTNLSEGTNQYYTVARANTAIDARVTKSFVDNLGVVANIANTVSTAAQPNITSVGTLTGLTANGTINLTGASNVSLGNVANVKITGGANGYILQTDGAGNIQWVDNLPSTLTFTANSIALTGGVFVSGNVSCIQTFGDYASGNVYVLTDGTGTAPAWQVDVDFLSVTGFNRVVLNINYTQASGHTVYVQLYNNTTSAWDSIGSYTGLGSYYGFALEVIDGTPYINGSGKVQLKLYHSNGGNSVHQTSIDYVALELSSQGPQGPRGPTGATGATGNGVVTGGTAGQVLIKNSSTNYDTAWTNDLTSLGNVTLTGNLTSINANLGNAVTANYFIGSGNNLSNIQVANVTGLGNIATINKDGNASNILYGNGSFAAAPVTYANSNVANYLPNYTGALSSSNLTVSVGNLHITGGNANYVLSTDGAGNLSWSAQSSGSQSNIAVTTDTFTGDGTTTVFSLSATPGSKDQTLVNYNGAMQLRSAYSLSGANITFSEAPASGSTIEVTTTSGVTSAGGTFVYRQYTGDGSTTAYSVSTSCDANTIIVTQNGVVQAPTLDYTVSSGTLTFITAPANGERIQVRELKTAISTASIPPAGSNTQVQFNNAGSFGSSANFAFDSSTKTLSVDNITVTGNIVPSANVTYSLGSATNAFKDLYLSGNTIVLGGAVIKADANTGAVAIVPTPTANTPNPTGILITGSGSVTTIATTGGNITANAISNVVANTTTAPQYGTGTISLSQPGNITPPFTGVARFYPIANLTITNVFASLGTVSSVNLGFTLKKNGSNVGNYTVTANTYRMSGTSANISVSTTDYLTLDVTSGTNATDLKVDLQYKLQ